MFSFIFEAVAVKREGLKFGTHFIENQMGLLQLNNQTRNRMFYFTVDLPGFGVILS